MIIPKPEKEVFIVVASYCSGEYTPDPEYEIIRVFESQEKADSYLLKEEEDFNKEQKSKKKRDRIEGYFWVEKHEVIS